MREMVLRWRFLKALRELEAWVDTDLGSLDAIPTIDDSLTIFCTL
jgi:hypothetical protein